MTQGITPTDTDYVMATLAEGAEVELITEESEDSKWLALAVSNFHTAKNYQDAALTTQWERNADHFNNRHYRRSVYNSRMFKGRSRLFRPLTRSAERSSSAQFAAAMFSNMEIISITPENQNDPMQVASAHIMQQVLTYRLEKTIPWYLTCLGAWQDTRVYGPCCTYTYWDYAEREVEKDVPEKDLMDNPIKDQTVKEMVTEIIRDQPVIDMVPVENLLLDPQCDWRDPVNSSPYVVRLVPMALDDVVAKMEEIDTKTGRPEWIAYTDEAILSVKTDLYNSVRQAREGDNRPDKMDSQERKEFKVIWAHENFVRLRGQEYVYWTLGTELLLTEVKKLEDVYHTGKRPLTYGFSIIEAHRFSPNSASELIAGLQTGINDVANLRFDNIKLALNKRYIIRRGAAVDLEALMKSIPGGGIQTDDPEKDIKVIETRDVTSSSYKEQERLETESNDLTGSFMGSSVQNNRALNETVGGMELLAEGANAVSEFDIRTFVETWVKPQLELLIQYEQAYETEDVIFNNAFDMAFKKLGYKYNLTEEKEIKNTFTTGQVTEIKNKVLNDKMTITVNVGLGATSPQRKTEMLTGALKTVVEIPGQMERLDGDEITKEVFAALGFQDGSRFIKGNKPGEEAPEITEQDVQAAYDKGAEEAVDPSKMASVEMQREIGMEKIASNERVLLAIQASKEGITIKTLIEKTGIEQAKDKTRRDVAASQSKSKRDEMAFKERTGKSGI